MTKFNAPYTTASDFMNLYPANLLIESIPKPLKCAKAGIITK